MTDKQYAVYMFLIKYIKEKWISTNLRRDSGWSRCKSKVNYQYKIDGVAGRWMG
jgi:hypothetical protein